MKTIMEAADSLLRKKSITQEEYGLIKESAIGLSTMDMLRNRLGAAALVGAVGLGANEIIISPLLEQKKINESYKMMKKKVPQLEGKDDKDIKDYFDVVKTFSPKAASNPLVAGSLVNKMMEFGGVDHKLVQDISALQTGLSRPSITQAATQAAAQSIFSKDKKDGPRSEPEAEYSE